MKILILGAGQVGSTIAHSLASEQNEITVIDTASEPLHALQLELDIRTVLGHAASPQILQHAGAQDVDMVLAVTTSDETNMVACQIAHTLFHTPTKIARIRSTEYHNYPQLFSRESIPVDVLISPERVVTSYLARLIEFPAALQVLDLVDGRLNLVGVRAEPGGPLVGRAISALSEDLSLDEIRVAALFRGDRPIMPEGHTIVEAGDEVFFLAARRHIGRVAAAFRQAERPNRRVLIAGGGNIGMGLAQTLETTISSVKVIEANRGRAENLAETLSRATVLRGDATDRALLVEEDIERVDVFCALTNDDEINIMAAMLAKRLGARRVIALVNRQSYVELVEGGMVDIVVSPQQVTIGAILPHVRRGHVLEAHPLRRGAAEALVGVAHGDARTSKTVGRSVDRLPLPVAASVGALIRDGEVIIAHHDTVIEEDDLIVIFLADRSQLREVEALFQVSAQFL